MSYRLSRSVMAPALMKCSRRHLIAAAVAVAVSSSVSAQVGGLSMTVSQADPRGSWALQEGNGFAHGVFTGAEFPSSYVSGFPISPGTTVVMDWLADSQDGFQGSMVVNGKQFALDGIPESFMQVTANAIEVNHPGLYQEPFAFSATLCAAATAGSLNCDVQLDASGVGALSMLVESVPTVPGAFEIQQMDYTIGQIKATPEPGTLILFATGIGMLGLCRRRAHRAYSGEFG